MLDHNLAIVDFETTGLDLLGKDLPIEIGLILVDKDLNLKAALSEFIKWPEFEAKCDWDTTQIEAFKTHKIPILQIKRDGITPEALVVQIDKLIKGPTYFISDNAWFDFTCLKLIYGKSAIPFNYNALNAKLLLKVTGEDRYRGEKSHRALEDAGMIHSALIRAFEKVKNVVAN